MKTGLIVGAVVCLVGAALSSSSMAQDLPPVQSMPEHGQPSPGVPLRVQVVLTRYDADKKIASLPFTLSVNANDQPAQLNMHTQVGVANNPTRAASGPDVPMPAVTSFTYKTIGTSIVCSATTLNDGRFRVILSVNDNSMLPDKTTDVQRAREAGVAGLPSFQEFTSSNLLILRDGQTTQYAAATDAVTGQVTKIEVTLTVIK